MLNASSCALPSSTWASTCSQSDRQRTAALALRSDDLKDTQGITDQYLWYRNPAIWVGVLCGL